MKKVISLFLCCVIAAFSVGCSTGEKDLMKGKTTTDNHTQYDFLSDGVTPPDEYEKFASAITDFSLELAKRSCDGKSSNIVSPASVFLALSMCANGAQRDTLDEFLQVLSDDDIDQDTLNRCMSYLSQRLSFFNDEKSHLSIANSIWIENSFKIASSFLNKNADFYNAGAFNIDFSDPSAPNAINSWVSDNTDGTIKKMVDKVDPSTMLYLINAVSLDDEWLTKYSDSDITDGTFHSADKDIDAKFMNSNEMYIKSDNAAGFVKSYKTIPCRFVAILPNEDTDIKEYMNSLDSKQWNELMESQSADSICEASLPQYKLEFERSLNGDLIDMGLKLPFTSEADFSRISTTSSLSISEVLHKAYIDVTPLGTKAGAATSVALSGSAMISDMPKVTLDRPFVFAIVDNESNIPVFMGCVTSV